jgi:DNA-binding MarR family transcriptional regulator
VDPLEPERDLETRRQPPSPARGAGPRALPPRGASAGSSPSLDLDRVIHEPLRLGLASALAVHGSLTFVELKERLQTTDGNLSVHARKLETAGYVSSVRSFEGRTPRTEYRLTHAGRKALERYLDAMETIIASVRKPAS